MSSTNPQNQAAGPVAGRRELFAIATEVEGLAARWAKLDTPFHRCYVEAGAGPRLHALHGAVKPQPEGYVRLSTRPARMSRHVGSRRRQCS